MSSLTPSLKETVGFLKQTPSGRKELIRKINFYDKDNKFKESDGNWQQNETPYSIVNKMIDKTSLEDKKILVMFNLEFIEQLIHVYNVSPGDIYFFADTELERNFAKSVYGVASAWGDASVMNNNGLLTRIFEMGQKTFDLVFSNPPYNNGVDLQILQQLRDNVNEMIVVHPSTWLVNNMVNYDINKMISTQSNMRNMYNNHIQSLDIFNGNSIFKIALSVPCVITHINTSIKTNGIIPRVTFMNNDVVENIELNDVTMHNKQWNNGVKPLFTNLKSYCAINGFIYNSNKSNGSFIVCIAKRTGHRNDTITDGAPLYKRDLHTLLPIDVNICKGMRKGDMDVFKFDTENEQINFLNYCATDFVRFSLSLLKLNQRQLNSSVGYLIPWMDFTQEWNDEKLFAHFKIDQETQDYIRNFLPDYHGIRDMHSVTVNGVKFQHKEIRELAKDIASYIGPKTIYEARQRQLSITGESPLVTGEIIHKEKPKHDNPTRKNYSDPPSKMIIQDDETWYLYVNHGIPKMKLMIEKMCELVGMTCQFN